MINPAINLWLSGNVPSSKNSKRIVLRRRKPILLWSDLATKYRVAVRHEMLAETPHWQALTRHLPQPIAVGFHFVRSSQRRFDFHNAVQTLSDLMVEVGWLEDDDMAHFLPQPLPVEGRWVTVNKDAPGVLIQPERV